MNKINLSNNKNNIVRKINKIFLILLITFLIFLQHMNVCFADEIVTQTPSAEAGIKHDLPTVYSKSSILMEQTTGQILFEHNAREKLYPASTTKLMTAILTLENCNLTDEVTVPKEALLGIPKSYTIAALQPGEKFTVDELLHVLLIPSANDAANVLACHISGSVESFSDLMNSKAKELGCENTHFVNPSGIHNDEHYSTAYDMALIGKYASTFDTITSIATNTSYSLPNTPDGKERNFKCTNTLINQKNQYYYEFATGLKTGYTDKAKSCIVATAKKDDMGLICVVLGGEKTEDRKAQRELDCKTLFEYGFSEFKYSDLCVANDFVDKSAINNLPSSMENVDLVYDDSLRILVRPDEDVPKTIDLRDDVELPIKKGTELGSVSYQINDDIYTVKLLAGNDVYPQSATSTKNTFFILIVVLVLVIIFTLIKRKNKPKDQKYFRRSLY